MRKRRRNDNSHYFRLKKSDDGLWVVYNDDGDVLYLTYKKEAKVVLDKLNLIHNALTNCIKQLDEKEEIIKDYEFKLLKLKMLQGDE